MSAFMRWERWGRGSSGFSCKAQGDDEKIGEGTVRERALQDE